MLSGNGPEHAHARQARLAARVRGPASTTWRAVLAVVPIDEHDLGVVGRVADDGVGRRRPKLCCELVCTSA